MRWLVASVLLLVGCSDAPPEHRALTLTERHERTQIELAKTPQPQVYRIDRNQLVVLDVPTETSFGMLEKHRCFVWRDAEFQTASINCPGDGTLVPSGVDAE